MTEQLNNTEFPTKQPPYPAYYIKNWREFQHYKHRNPPWIKLHTKILSSPEWVMLTDSGKLSMICCMVVASMNDGWVRNDTKWIKEVCHIDWRVDFKPLIECGFLTDPLANASSMLASASNVLARDRAETETETETETEKKVSKKDIAEPAVQPVSEGKRNSRKKREQGHRLPTEWRPTLRHYALGEELGIGAAGVDSAAEDMRLWAEANAHRAVARKSNWDATFTGWMKRNMNNSFTGNNGGGNGHRRPQTLKERTADALQRLGSGSFGENVDLRLPKLSPD